jgi:hypothetical protein
VSLGAVLLVALPAPKAAAAPCYAPIVNEIACENTKTGNASSEWQISRSGSSSIQGFATDISVDRGSTIGFKVKTNSSNYRLDTYRATTAAQVPGKWRRSIPPPLLRNRPARSKPAPD